MDNYSFTKELVTSTEYNASPDVWNAGSSGGTNENIQSNTNSDNNEFEMAPPKRRRPGLLSVIIHGQFVSVLSKDQSSSEDTKNTCDTSLSTGYDNAGRNRQARVSNISQGVQPSCDVTRPEVRIYKRRIWILFLFSMCSLMNAMAWIQYSIITNITICYYDVTVNDVNWTALVYLIVYVILVFPTACFLDRYGLRITILVGCFLNFLSAVVQCGSLDPDGFPIALFAQIIAAIGQNFILNLPPRLAAVWFGPAEVSRATSVGVFGNQFGTALGFLFPPYVTSDDCAHKSAIRPGKEIVTYTLVAVNLVLLLLIVLTFENKPQFPPSPAEANKVEECNYTKSIISLSRDRNFLLLCIGYGSSVGMYWAFAIVLSAMLEPVYPQQETDIGMIGFGSAVAGLIGMVIAGYTLDITHKFKEVSMIILVCSFLLMCALTGFLHIPQIWIPYVIITIFGLFITSYIPVGFEFAAEVTYPEPEGTTAGLMNAVALSLGAIFTVVGSELLSKYGNLACNIFFSVVLLIGCVTTGWVKCECRRLMQNTEESRAKIENERRENQKNSHIDLSFPKLSSDIEVF